MKVNKPYEIDIKILITAIAVFFILFAFACNNLKDKKDVVKDVKDLSDEIKTTSDKSIIINPDPIEQEELQPIECIVKEILITSPRFKQLTKGLNELVIKNGGLSFAILMEKSPDQSKSNEYSYSKTYDFTVYEIYPERRLSTARFSFNPDNKQLYEYDAVNDQLKPIKFDKNLLLQYNALCK